MRLRYVNPVLGLLLVSCTSVPPLPTNGFEAACRARGGSVIETGGGPGNLRTLTCVEYPSWPPPLPHLDRAVTEGIQQRNIQRGLTR